MLLANDTAEYTGEEFTVMIDRFDVDRIAKTAKPPRKAACGEASRSVDIEHDAGTGRLVFTFSTGESLTVETVAREFPKYRQLIPAEQRDTEGYLAVNATYLAKFAKVIADPWSSQMYMSAGKPIAVRIGDNFVGMEMPVRTDRAGWDLPNWL